jgi:hypothetical protein
MTTHAARTVSPYLIQRGTIREGYKATDRYSLTVDDDYMGCSEFEWGAKPKSLRRLQADASELSAAKVDCVRNAAGRPLIMYGNFTTRHDEKEYGYLIRDVANGLARTKEYTGFAPHVTGERGWTRQTSVWDIENDVFMSFDPKFMRDLPAILRNSWTYMDGGK